uniref:Uncharacterized protein n=1 Tax=Kuenenia stuttgartiensis TaxID=174633 RepID=Q1Q587_KUEST|nr:unknown protein [Candidatus Kuenenia stuttgartiensis]
MNETNQRNLKDLILGARTYPFINEDDAWAKDEYSKHNFCFEYVKSIINSLPWNNKTTNFIRRVYPNGLIEVVL